MQTSLNDDHMNDLFETIASLQTSEDCSKLFHDLCTISELLSLRQRFWVARLLNEGLGYNEIVKETGASTATISRVSRCLNYGQGGYQAVLRDNKED